MRGDVAVGAAPVLHQQRKNLSVNVVHMRIIAQLRVMIGD